MKNHKILNYIGIGIFILFLSLPTIFGILLPNSSNVQIENRRLADLPAMPKNLQEFKLMPNKIDDYYADHFGFRWSFLYIYRHLKYFIHDSPIKIAKFGNEPGWIFYDSKKDGDNIGNYRNINHFSKKQLQSFIFKIKAKQKWLADRGIKYLFILAPSKQYIYPEYLPDYIKATNQQNIISQLSEELSLHPEINFLNLTPVLKRAKKNRLLYYKADSHWNLFGANIAQFEIAKKLAQLYPEHIKPYLHPDDIFKPEKFQGGLAQRMGLGSYFEEQNFVPQLNACATNLIPKKTIFNQTFSTQCSQDGLNAIIFRDSFFSSLQPYISLYFSSSQYIWKNLSVARLKKYVDTNTPDIVIEERVDRSIH